MITYFKKNSTLPLLVVFIYKNFDIKNNKINNNNLLAKLKKVFVILKYYTIC